MQTLTLSWPPSTNDLWRAFKGRNILSRKARAWYEAASLELLAQKAKPIKGPVWVTIALQSPFKRSYDPDNRIKCLLDLLVKNSILEGDSNSIIHRLTVYTQMVGFEGALVTIQEAHHEQEMG